MESLHASGRVRLLGVSNVSLEQLESLVGDARVRPRFVQNRCYASQGWDHDVRQFCHAHEIVYQGFSLLTANPEVLHHPLVIGLAARADATAAQVVFGFARAAGMLPLTGTSNAEHMKQDLASADLTISPDAVQAIESLAG